MASGEERILFMTTNHIEALDPALIRPGRVDVIELLDDASPSQARRLFLQFYGPGSQEPTQLEPRLIKVAHELEELVARKATQGLRISMASLQGVFIMYSPEDAINQCDGSFIKR